MCRSSTMMTGLAILSLTSSQKSLKEKNEKKSWHLFLCDTADICQNHLEQPMLCKYVTWWLWTTIELMEMRNRISTDCIFRQLPTQELCMAVEGEEASQVWVGRLQGVWAEDKEVAVRPAAAPTHRYFPQFLHSCTHKLWTCRRVANFCKSRFLDTRWLAPQSIIICTQGTSWLYNALISFQNFSTKAINYLHNNQKIFWELNYWEPFALCNQNSTTILM